jgi:DNA-binding transcriptional regulator WhiA
MRYIKILRRPNNQMRFSERNRANIRTYWQKRQAKERAWISNNSKNKLHLKALVFGYLAGDGHVGIREEKDLGAHNEAAFYPDDPSMMSQFLVALKAVYNITPTIRKHQNFYSIRFNSKVVIEDLLKNAAFGVRTWSIPHFVKTDKNLLKDWLKAFFDAEGYISNKVIRVQTVNEKGIKEIQKLLGLFHIKSRRYKYLPKNIKWSANHILVISEKESRLKFLNEIGLNHSIKLTKLKESLLT